MHWCSVVCSAWMTAPDCIDSVAPASAVVIAPLASHSDSSCCHSMIEFVATVDLPVIIKSKSKPKQIFPISPSYLEFPFVVSASLPHTITIAFAVTKFKCYLLLVN